MKWRRALSRTFLVFCRGIPVMVICLLFAPERALSVPAHPTRTFEVIQPDGITKLTLRVIGDERNGRLITEDGYTVVQDADGWYCYAVLDVAGELTASSLRANVSEKRSTAEESFLAQIPLRLAATNRIGKPDPNALARTVHRTVAKRGVKTTNNVLLILIRFQNESNTFLPDDFRSLMNGPCPPPGSLRNYYNEVSYGALDISATVVGFYTASQDRNYYRYGTGPDSLSKWIRAARLAREAIVAAESAGVNFAPFDNDDDDYVDGLFIAHVGLDAAWGYTDYPWSHSWSLTWAGLDSVVADGKIISPYTMEPEMLEPGVFTTIGVYAHEYGHALGLPDLYDYDGSSLGVGYWCLMSSGADNGIYRAGDSPAHMSAWCKQRLGWLPVTQLYSDVSNRPINQVETNQVCFRLGNGLMAGTEYFLVENRELTGFDAALPGCGMAIWHVDDTREDNDSDTYRWVDLEEADGDDWPADAGDLWINQTFNGASVPNSNSYSGAATAVEVKVLSTACAQTMNADLKVEYYRCGDVNGDGIPNTVSDLIYLTRYIISGDVPELLPPLSGNVDGCYRVNMSDLVFLRRCLSGNGPPPANCENTTDCRQITQGNKVRLECPVVSPTAVAGDSIAIRVHITNDVDLGGFSLGFRYNSDAVEITSLTAGAIIPVGTGLSKVFVPASNRVLVNWLDGSGGDYPIVPQVDGLAFTLYMKLLPGVTPHSVDIDSAFVLPAGDFLFCPGAGGSIIPKYVDCGTVDVAIGYKCGDANGDKTVDISDAVSLISYIFAGGPAPSPLDAGDANCDGTVDISDAVSLISYIFAGGPAPCAECK